MQKILYFVLRPFVLILRPLITETKKNVIRSGKLAEKVKKAAYGKESVLEQEYYYVKTQVENIVKIQYNNLGLKDKLKSKWIYNL